jgi:hypothetical protein
MENTGLLVILAFIAVAVFFFIQRARAGSIPEIRTIAALEALEEGVGRAVEMNKPIHYFLAASGGLFGGRGVTGPLAALGVLSYVSRLSALREAELVFACNNPETTVLAEDVMRTGYTAEGKLDSFDAQHQVRYYTNQGGAYKNAIAGYLMRERPAVSIMMGDISNEAVFLSDMSQIAGCMTIAGCQRETQLAFLVALCDYVMVGEELLVAGAYLTKNPLVLGSIAGQDMAKYLAIALAAGGALLATAGSSIVADFLAM